MIAGCYKYGLVCYLLVETQERARLKRKTKRGRFFLLNKAAKLLQALRKHHTELKRHKDRAICHAPTIEAWNRSVMRTSLHSQAFFGVQEARLLLTADLDARVLDCNEAFLRFIDFEGRAPLRARMIDLCEPESNDLFNGTFLSVLELGAVECVNSTSIKGDSIGNVLAIVSYDQSEPVPPLYPTEESIQRFRQHRRRTARCIDIYMYNSRPFEGTPPPLILRTLSGTVLQVAPQPLVTPESQSTLKARQAMAVADALALEQHTAAIESAVLFKRTAPQRLDLVPKHAELPVFAARCRASHAGTAKDSGTFGPSSMQSNAVSAAPDIASYSAALNAEGTAFAASVMASPHAGLGVTSSYSRHPTSYDTSVATAWPSQPQIDDNWFHDVQPTPANPYCHSGASSIATMLSFGNIDGSKDAVALAGDVGSASGVGILDLDLGCFGDEPSSGSNRTRSSGDPCINVASSYSVDPSVDFGRYSLTSPVGFGFDNFQPPAATICSDSTDSAVLSTNVPAWLTFSADMGSVFTSNTAPASPAALWLSLSGAVGASSVSAVRAAPSQAQATHLEITTMPTAITDCPTADCHGADYVDGSTDAYGHAACSTRDELARD
jgi:hypothetical protein